MPKTLVTLADFNELRYGALFKDGKLIIISVHVEKGKETVRGKRVFEHQIGATWHCIECMDPYLKSNNIRDCHPETVLEPVLLKARDYIARKIQVLSKPKESARPKAESN